MKVAVIGGGPAGLLTAVLLKRRRVAREVVVWERGRADDTGFGVILPPEVFDLLREVLPRLADTLARHAVSWRTTTVRRGQESWTTPTPELYAIARSAVNRMLWEACAADGVILRKRHAPAVEALATAYDLVVRADGAGSPVSALGFDVTVHEVGPRYAWLGLDMALKGLTFLTERSTAGLYMAHAYPFNAMASTFLVEGPRPLEPAELSRLFGLPVRASRSAGWRTFRERTVHPWARENIVLVGDAAHTTHYSIGFGTYLAMQDAVALVDGLSAAPAMESALTAYEADRRPAVELAQERGRRSAGWFTRVEEELTLPIGRFTANLLTRGGQ